MKSKTILWAGLSLLFLVHVSVAQEKKEQKKNEKKTKQKVEIKIPGKNNPQVITSNPDSLTGFMDRNANGIDDRFELRKGKRGENRKKDKFIDLNGDGICDGRESALGLKKTHRNRKGRGGKK